MGPVWRDEWTKMYPDLKVDWRTVISRYNYHFGGIQEHSLAKEEVSATPSSVSEEGGRLSVESTKENMANGSLSPSHSLVQDDGDDTKVKGFRNWSQQAKQDLIKTRDKLVLENPTLEPGSSDFNRSLLKEFQKLHPKCMESSRSIFSKLQSIEKGDPKPPPPQIVRRSSVKTDVAKKDQLSTIEGFEDWTMMMIHNFISCMDTARKRCATLRESKPESQVKLVPLLLDEWRTLYPNSKETVKTFLNKIKHLKTQKEDIKLHLGQSGLLPKLDSEHEEDEEGEPFKWRRDMIKDVIESRRKAMDIKNQGLARGQKLSFHSLWASEFRRVHPTSTFTSNNLSVHFWTWRKQQAKTNGTHRRRAAASPPNHHHRHQDEDNAATGTKNGVGKWSRDMKKQLLEIGNKVETLLQAPDTPNDVKLEGFSNVLYQEWKKSFQPPPNSKVEIGNTSSRAVNMMYSRLLREGLGEPEELNESKIYATWTPKHNRVLKECIENQVCLHKASNSVILEHPFTGAVIRNWRKKFPKSSIANDDLTRRMKEALATDEFADIEVEPVQDQTHVVEEPPQRDASTEPQPVAHRKSVDSVESFDGSLEGRVPNAKGQLVWNQQSITDLFQSYFNGSFKFKENQNDALPLSHYVHAAFTDLYPFCKLSAPLLMAKYYHWKTQFEEGQLDFTLPDFQRNTEAPAELERNGMPLEDIKTKPAAAKRKSKPEPKAAKELVFRTWTQDMIDDMLKTRKMAIARKKKILESNPSDIINITDYWYDEFVKLHPDYKSTKKNLWRKYKWYKSRISDPTEDKEEAEGGKADKADKAGQPERDEKENAQKEAQEPIKLKTIRKDMFHFIKTVLEASKIFLPMKLPEPDGATAPPPPPSHPLPPPPPLKAAPSIAIANRSSLDEPLDLATEKPSHLSHVVTQTEEVRHNSSIKLPGGATLVAVTERSLEKPKQVEKPHVTITIGEKDEPQELHIPEVDGAAVAGAAVAAAAAAEQQTSITAILRTPNETIPLQIPFPIHVPPFPPNNRPPVVPPPPLTQLKPSQEVKSAMRPFVIPPRMKDRLNELHLTDGMFFDLLKIYENTREEYINSLKKGYLMFFPFLMGFRWKECYPNWPIPGRKLVAVADAFVEEKRKHRPWLPEYLTKVPCSFTVEETMLRHVMLCHIETKKSLEKDFEERYGANNAPLDPAFVYVEMCKTWSKHHPDTKLTTKQLISIHRMLDYEIGRDDPSPETVCQKVDIWRLLDKEVPDAKFRLREDETCVPQEEEKAKEATTYDASTVSMELLQEWILATSNLNSSHKQQVKERARYVTKNPRLFWSNRRLEDLKKCMGVAAQRFRKVRRRSQLNMIYSAFCSLHPQTTERLTKFQVMAKGKRLIRKEKRTENRRIQRQIRRWEKEAMRYLEEEENVQVLPFQEDDPMETEDAAEAASGGGGFSGRLTSLNKTYGCLKHDAGQRNFNRDDDVLAYIRQMQKTSKTNHSITWTADVIGDLVKARTEARRRKREWEAWATKEYGGVGIAYNNPNIHYEKVDEMFKQEWAKLRPHLANLSIWTLVSYARKYDNLKKQLLADNNQKFEPISETYARKTSADVVQPKGPTYSKVYFENSCIPKFNLDDLDCVAGVSGEFKDLLTTRQLAKQRQVEGNESDRKMRLQYLWRSEWNKLHPESRVNGHFLMKRLWTLERLGSNWSRVKRALQRTLDPPCLPPVQQDDEDLAVKPRRPVFPEDDGLDPLEDDVLSNGNSIKMWTGVGTLRPTKLDDAESGGEEDEIFRLFPFDRDLHGQSALNIEVPTLQLAKRDPHMDAVQYTAERWMAKGYTYRDSTRNQSVDMKVADSAFHCMKCDQSYQNFNDLQYHAKLH